MKNLILILAICVSMHYQGQERIDGTFPFQNDPAKKYSLFIPVDYNANTPHRAMLALHPLNTDRWDGESWCDTLIQFATMNSLILISPDGGLDGAIDDPIDTAFTSALLDSVFSWYNIDQAKVYIMGFSWGGKTTYTYGLNHADKFGGFMPIGAAINGTGEINSVLSISTGKPFYLVHGGNDSPAQRFWPLLEALDNNQAITNYNLMSGITHTIDFPNRNEILSIAYQWIDSVNCSVSSNVSEYELTPVALYPNILFEEKVITLDLRNWEPNIGHVSIMNQAGQLVWKKELRGGVLANLDLNRVLENKGLYFMRFKQGTNQGMAKIIVLE